MHIVSIDTVLFLSAMEYEVTKTKSCVGECIELLSSYPVEQTKIDSDYWSPKANN
jgi:hypothetical protein